MSDTKQAAKKSWLQKLGLDRKANLEEAKKRREANKGKPVSIRGTKIPQKN